MKCFGREHKDSSEECWEPKKPNLGKEMLNCFSSLLRKGLPDPIPWQLFIRTIILLTTSGSRVPTTRTKKGRFSS